MTHSCQVSGEQPTWGTIMPTTNQNNDAGGRVPLLSRRLQSPTAARLDGHLWSIRPGRVRRGGGWCIEIRLGGKVP